MSVLHEISRAIGRVEERSILHGEDMKEVKQGIKNVEAKVLGQIQTIKDNCDVCTKDIQEKISLNTKFRTMFRDNVKFAKRAIVGLGVVVNALFYGGYKLWIFLSTHIGGGK